jgi:hypothetical protein
LLIPRLGTGGGASLAIAGYFLYNLMATGFPTRSASWPIGEATRARRCSSSVS